MALTLSSAHSMAEAQCVLGFHERPWSRRGHRSGSMPCPIGSPTGGRDGTKDDFDHRPSDRGGLGCVGQRAGDDGRRHDRRDHDHEFLQHELAPSPGGRGVRIRADPRPLRAQPRFCCTRIEGFFERISSSLTADSQKSASAEAPCPAQRCCRRLVCDRHRVVRTALPKARPEVESTTTADPSEIQSYLLTGLATGGEWASAVSATSSASIIACRSNPGGGATPAPTASARTFRMETVPTKGTKGLAPSVAANRSRARSDCPSMWLTAASPTPCSLSHWMMQTFVCACPG